jgi:aminopeptidase N
MRLIRDRRKWRGGCAAGAALALFAGAALAGGGYEACMEARTGLLPAMASPGFDAETGRDLQNYPPDRVADLQHMRLEIFIADMNTPSFTASQTLRFEPIGTPLEVLTLDARGMAITSVAMEGHETRFSHDGQKLTVTFVPAVPVGASGELLIDYRVENPPLGLIWTPESPAWPGRPAQLHTQGQPETNSFWFPCRDFPNERLTTELIVTVPAGYLVSSNGYLAEHRREIITVESRAGTRQMKPYDRFHWVQEAPHVAYLVSLVVGKFDVVDVGTPRLPMPVYAPVGRGAEVPATFGRTREMVALFERLTGQPYPWARYAQVLVHNFGAGGMENTSATTLYDECLLRPEALLDHDSEGLISHELAHQWFGDLVTCNSWEHIWLNEGLATYFTWLWFEHRDGAERYAREVIAGFDSVIWADRGEAPDAAGMVSKRYEHPWDVFRRPANPYSKGASVLHMLRCRLGDEVFFEGVRLFLERRRMQTAETSDLRTALEAVSGESLEQFFAQWTERPGIPRLRVRPEWDARRKVLSITAEQTQRVDGDNPAFEFSVPVAVGTSGGFEAHRLVVEGRTAKLEVPLESPPAFVCVDPGGSVLAEWMVQQSDEAWLRQLSAGLGVGPMVQACRGIGAGAGPLTTAAKERLRRTADDRSLPVFVRREAVRALAARQAVLDVRALASAAVDAWEMRIATSEALAQLVDAPEMARGTALREGAERFLAERARKDRSIRARAAAVRALASFAGEEAQAVILESLKVDSQADTLRTAALDALAALGDRAPAQALRIAAGYTAPGYDPRTRAVAATAVARLKHQDGDLALRTLLKMLEEPELRTQIGAGNALAELKDPRALEPLERLLESAPGEEHRHLYRQWLNRIRE